MTWSGLHHSTVRIAHLSFETMFLIHSRVAESTTPPGTPPRSAVAATATPAAKSGDLSSSPAKRKYVPDSSDMEIVKKIRLSEIELRDRNSVLRGFKSNVSDSHSVSWATY